MRFDQITPELRDLSSMTLTLNLKDLPELKKQIRNFRKNFMTQAESEIGQEVYKLSVQLIPVTKLDIKETK